MNTRIIRFLFGTTIALAIALLLLVLPVPTRTVSSAPAAYTIVIVSTTADEFGAGSACSLREAIKSQNDNVSFGGCLRGVVPGPGGTDTIFLPSGTYTLTQSGSGEDLDATGDLDIRASVIISTTGASPATVTGGAGWNERIFDIVTGTVTFKGLAIRGGHAANGGGVRIFFGQSLTFNDGEVADSTANYGGGITNIGMLTLSNMTLSGNSASNGGGIRNYGRAALTNVTLSDNSAFGGGGIYNSGIMTLTNVTLNRNSAANAADAKGGGIYNSGIMTLTNVTLSDNSAANNGGGILNTGTATLTNVTLSGNSTTNGGGGGIYHGNGTATLTNVTLSGNSAVDGGGIYRSAGTITVTNTIVANSPFGGNCSPSLGGSFNLSSDNMCGFGASRDNVNVMLGPLANNGGSTLTHLPLPGSPAIDFGTNIGCPATDQRGTPRPIGAVCDVGAVEAVYIFLPLILK
jgi:CSLREA domain-containing protein